MPTTYTDQFYLIDPGSPPAAGTSLTVNFFDLLDGNDDGLIGSYNSDRVDGQQLTDVWQGDTVTVQLPDGSTTTYTGTTFYLDDGRRVFTPSDGAILQDATFVSATYVTTGSSFPVRDLGPSCFTPGTRIATPCGARPVDSLQPGDLVLTEDAGPVPVLFLHHRSFGARILAGQPNHNPVRIDAGALGNGLPRRALTLSFQHRVLLRSAIVERMFGQPEVLAPVGHMTGAPGITHLKVRAVNYIHIVLAQHHVIRAEGASVETFFLGPQAREAFSPGELSGIRRALNGAAGPTQPARLLVRGARLRHAVQRHIRNGKDLCAPAPGAELLKTG